ncbi:hypothetical protein J6R97_00345 [bacterium]|nr:hypothetical protein [bacterium]
MKEQDFLNIIKRETNSHYIGDDCAYLKELGIVITQDNFVENVHFKREWATPFQIGYKAVTVNISDILASGAEPAYLTIGLSIPNVNNEFIEELYRGIKAGSHGAEIIGGDITGGDKIFISITAIGKTHSRKIASRNHAKNGYVVIASGEFGESAKGLDELKKGLKNTPSINTHLEPKLDIQFSESISTRIKTDYAMMDTSDGLADALFQIAKSSNVKIITTNIEGMFGAEDYKLIAAVPKDFLSSISDYKIIGSVVNFDGSFLQIDNKQYSSYDELALYNHFGDNNE